MRLAVLLAVGCFLAGCQTMNDQFQYIDKVYDQPMPEGSYRIREHPKGDRLMVTPNWSKIVESGLVAGVGIDTLPSPAQYQAAGRAYMDAHGRANCVYQSSRPLMKPHMEVVFTCSG